MIRRVLKADSEAVDIRNLTRVDCLIHDLTVSSLTEPDVFDWTTEGVNGILRLRLGLANNIDTEAGKRTVRIVVFDTANPEGLAWGEFAAVIFTPEQF